MSGPINAGITGVGSYLPDQVLTNDAIAHNFDKPGSWITDRTAIQARRVADPSESPVEMAAAATTAALAAAGVPAERVGLILATSSTPGRFMPSIACGVQRRIGARHATGLDVNAACAGFLFALHLALSTMTSGAVAGPVVVVATERYSRHLDYQDRATASLFGDGAGAIVLDTVADGYGFIHTSIGSDGELEDNVRLDLEPGHVVMNGRGTREFIEHRLPAMVLTAAKAAETDLDAVDLIVPHQANMRLVTGLLTGVGVRSDQIWATGHRYGNTGAASVPITLDDAVRHGALTDGQVVLMAAIGAGMTWGTAVLRWGGDRR
ncbi:3-oxoacyl-ACP synthase III family protein [Nocardia australiensis]|uniref:3-oxoacyl-ACP synthase III family protein n=1 Tax=Nocardia australiensis TaxID=2887191 RepID=UPI001D1357AB|nr:ketoacyl-ACP synthase III [Nocardia australiensis]